MKNTIMEYEVIDNFLPANEFQILENIFFTEKNDKIKAKMADLNDRLSMMNSGETRLSDAEIAKINEEITPQEMNEYLSSSSFGLPAVKWIYNKTVAGIKFDDPNKWRHFHFDHEIFNENYDCDSLIYPYIKPILKLLDIKTLKRIKCNLFPNTETVEEHAFHTDNDSPVFAALLSINTCDGYTTLKDGTKIDSVANRILKFNGNTLHKSSTTSNQTVRININFNYL